MAPIKMVLLRIPPSTRNAGCPHRRIISSVEGADRAFYSATMSSDARSGNTVWDGWPEKIHNKSTPFIHLIYSGYWFYWVYPGYTYWFYWVPIPFMVTSLRRKSLRLINFFWVGYASGRSTRTWGKQGGFGYVFCRGNLWLLVTRMSCWNWS